MSSPSDATGAGVPASLRWCSDGCPCCDQILVLPVQRLERTRAVVALRYRCPDCGHAWTTWYDRHFAAHHATATREEVAAYGVRAVQRECRTWGTRHE